MSPLIDQTSSLDATHITVGALASLLPFAAVAGGSFRKWLPPPGTQAFDESQELFADAVELATRQTLLILCPNSSVKSAPTGGRAWPKGICGSLTHKGTVVLGAVAEQALYDSIGIDLERIVEGHLSSEIPEIAPEGLPSGLSLEMAATCAFSAKEAVFKADFSETEQRLEFADVRLDWDLVSPTAFRATAQVGTRRFAVLGVMPGSRWVVSAAISGLPARA
jgi:4'-phosphopantetheinyl transferase EntD